MVVTDGLLHAALSLDSPDAAIAGVLAHEIGHVVNRDGMRLLIEHGVLAFCLGLALGDLSGGVASGATLLGGLAYHRRHEQEADCFARDLLHRAALPTGPMADLLLVLSNEASASSRAGVPQLLSTHPLGADRAALLRLADGGCGRPGRPPG